MKTFSIIAGIALALPSFAQISINGVQNQTFDSYGLPFSHAANTTVWLGDSITDYGSAVGNGPDQSFGFGWTAQATFLSNGKIQQLFNLGIPGNTTAQMLARFNTDVIAKNPGKVVIMGGTNDLPTGAIYTAASLAQSMLNMAKMIDLATFAGIEPIICTIPPRNDSTFALSNSQIYNQGIRQLTAQKQIPLVDMYAAVADPITGAYITAYGKADNVHPTPLGSFVMAQKFVSATANLYAPSQEYLPVSNAEAFNLVSNALFLNAVTAWSSTQSGTMPAAAFSTVAGTGTDVGNWMQVSFPAATAAAQTKTFNYGTGFAVTPGHNYAMAFRWSISGLAANAGQLSIQFGAGTPQPVYGYTSDLASGVFYMEQVVPAGSTTWNPGFTLTSPAAGTVPTVLKVAQFGVVDLTGISINAGGGGTGGGPPPNFVDPGTGQSFTQAIAGGNLVLNNDYEFGTGGGRNVTNATQLGAIFDPYGIAGTTVINQEWERYQPFSSSANFVFQTNSLDLVAEISHSGGSMTAGGINSGQIITKQQFKPGVNAALNQTGAYTYASEVSMQTPSGVGTWPASWYYVKTPGQTDPGNWCPAGTGCPSSEIDNPEFFYYQTGQTKDTWTGNQHGPGQGSYPYQAPGVTINVPPGSGNLYTPGTIFSNGYHLYQTYWTPDKVYKYIDGVLVLVNNFTWTAPGASQFYVNLAVGTDANFGTVFQPNNTNEFPSQTTLHVNYIKLWSK